MDSVILKAATNWLDRWSIIFLVPIRELRVQGDCYLETGETDPSLERQLPSAYLERSHRRPNLMGILGCSVAWLLEAEVDWWRGNNKRWVVLLPGTTSHGSNKHLKKGSLCGVSRGKRKSNHCEGDSKPSQWHLNYLWTWPYSRWERNSSYSITSSLPIPPKENKQTQKQGKPQNRQET